MPFEAHVYAIVVVVEAGDRDRYLHGSKYSLLSPWPKRSLALVVCLVGCFKAKKHALCRLRASIVRSSEIVYFSFSPGNLYAELDMTSLALLAA